MVKDGVERIVRSLSSEPDAVEIDEIGDGKNVRFEVRASPGDMGRIIGREGRTIKAIRNILFAVGHKHGRRFHLDLIED